MPEYSPEGSSSKWSLLSAYNPDSSELNKIEPLYMEDTTKGLLVANYVWDTTTAGWVKQTQNVLITDSVYLAVDELEDLLKATNTTYLVNIMADTAVMAADTPLMVVDLDAIRVAVEIMDDWDESDRCKVNLIAGQAGIAAGAGATTADTPRMTLASDTPLGVIDDNLGHYKIDDYDVSGDPLYVGFQDKDGNYYIMRVTTATSAVDYTKGAAGYAAAWTNRAAESYDSFEATF